MIADLLNTNLIKVPLERSGKKEVIAELVDLLVSNHKVKDRNKAYQAILEREEVMSTGVGESVAIPHGKSDGVDEVVGAFGISQKDIDFASIDNKPVRLVFLLITTPNETSSHLKVLSRVSRLLNKKEFRNNLLEATSSKQVLNLIRKEESSLEN